jgi:hypothetical protein
MAHKCKNKYKESLKKEKERKEKTRKKKTNSHICTEQGC